MDTEREREREIKIERERECGNQIIKQKVTHEPETKCHLNRFLKIEYCLQNRITRKIYLKKYHEMKLTMKTRNSAYLYWA